MSVIALLVDEVAHTSYDTPSKVIAGIEQLIVKRARDALPTTTPSSKRRNRPPDSARR